MFRKIIPLSILVVLLACSVAYFPPYDAGFATGVLSLKTQTLAFIDDGAEDPYFLDRTSRQSAFQQIDDLRAKASIYQRNDQTQKMIGLLENNIAILKSLTDRGENQPEVLAIIRNTLEGQFDAILTLENSKRKEAVGHE